MDEIAAAIAGEIDGKFKVGGRHELSLTDFASPSSARIWRQISALNEPERIHEFRLEHRTAAAVVSERRKRTQSWAIASHRAKIRLQPPDRDDHRGRHPIDLLDP